MKAIVYLFKYKNIVFKITIVGNKNALDKLPNRSFNKYN